MGQVEDAIADLARVCRDAALSGDITSTDELRAVFAYHLAGDTRWNWSKIGDTLGVSADRARCLGRRHARTHRSPDPGQSPAEFAAWRQSKVVPA